MDKIALINTVKPYTGLSRLSLEWFYDFAHEKVMVPGAVVECGVANGGSAVLLWHACGGGNRNLWMFDSWEGLPKPEAKDGGRAISKWEHKINTQGDWCKGNEWLARKTAYLADVPEERLHTVRGWFSDTLPEWASKVGPIAMLHLDADWYRSTLDCLTYLYPLLVSGGLLVLNDYGHWPGTDQACKEYGIDNMLTATPPCGAWMIKE